MVLLGWHYLLNQPSEDLTAKIKSKDMPDYVAQGVNTLVYSLDGIQQYFAEADKVVYFQENGTTLFTMPVVYLFQMNKQTNLIERSWKLRSNHAQLDKDKMLYLTGNVLIESLLPESKIKTLTTENAQVNLTTQDILSDTMVSVAGAQFVTTGNRLQGNLRQQIATLKEQVKTQYEINTQQ